MNGAWRAGLFAAAAIVFAATVWGMQAGKVYRHGSFKAFYCAGKAVAQRRDPYRVEPLRSCQRSVNALLDPGEVEPAPLPGYDLAAFALISGFSFDRAAAVFNGCAVLAILAAALLVASVADIPAVLVLLMFMPLALLNIAYSEVPVFALAALALCGWALKHERWTLAGIAGAATLIQPQVAVPVVLALLVFVPRARVALICSLLALGAVSVAALGFGTNVEYARAVLPVQAASELAAADQYSLSHALFSLGFSAKAALLAGQACLALMIGIGMLCAHAARKRLNAPELIAFLPAAAVLLGGLYLHDIQFIIALPAAIVVAARVEPARRAACWIALTALAVVWSQHPSRSVVALNLLAAVAVGIAAAEGPGLMRTAKGLVAGAAVWALLVALHGGAAAAAGVQSFPSPAANDLAANAWAQYLSATPDRITETPFTVLAKVPTWLALITLLAAAGIPRRRHLTMGTIGSGFVSEVST